MKRTLFYCQHKISNGSTIYSLPLEMKTAIIKKSNFDGNKKCLTVSPPFILTDP